MVSMIHKAIANIAKEKETCVSGGRKWRISDLNDVVFQK